MTRPAASPAAIKRRKRPQQDSNLRTRLRRLLLCRPLTWANVRGVRLSGHVSVTARPHTYRHVPDLGKQWRRRRRKDSNPRHPGPQPGTAADKSPVQVGKRWSATFDQRERPRLTESDRGSPLPLCSRVGFREGGPDEHRGDELGVGARPARVTSAWCCWRQPKCARTTTARCWPLVPRLPRESNISARRVRRVIARLWERDCGRAPLRRAGRVAEPL